MRYPHQLFCKIITLISSVLVTEAFSLESHLLSELQRQGLEKLERIHSTARLIHGSFLFEYPEQLITSMYMPADAKVLELGSNLGNNSIVISRILNDSSNLVTLETREEVIPLLKENRDANNLNFHIEWGALSERALIQKGWITTPGDTSSEGSFKVNTITFDQLQEKYDITFDALVVDAEGALYQILVDKPDLLTNIKLIIIENDFACEDHCLFVVNLFKQYGLELVHSEGGKYYGDNEFNQVWKKS